MRTEHQLRMAFEPGYEKRYGLLQIEREAIWGAFIAEEIRSFPRGNFIFILVYSIAISLVLLNFLALFILPLSYLVSFFIYFAYYEVKTKKRLNLPLFLL